ncbi:MAG: copper homeostasis protein CutC [Bacteroidales bacterium]|nr:copper homeostasis protein CutC [Bacteroidales bacterium]
MQRGIIFECCCQSVRDAVEAQEGGARRIELCSRLEVGGVSPSERLIAEVLEAVSIPVNVLVRPREGNFCYSPSEAEEILEHIAICKRLKVNGVVIGALTPDGQIDVPLVSRFIRAARPLEVTFHRAFDECAEPRTALEDIIALGCDTLLTSGHAPSALEGCALIASLVEQAAGRISIMPGAGINPSNIRQIVLTTGAGQYHGSARGSAGTTSRTVVGSIVNAFSRG